MKELMNEIGQLFMVGFRGEKPSPVFLDFIAETQIGGVILFADNCTTHQTAADNIELIKAQYRSVFPLIAIDQEGGRVCRLKGAPAEYKSAATYGATGDIDRFAEEFSRSMVFMESIGINVNLAPVADLAINPENSCLKDRCFGDSPDKVARFVETAVEIAARSRMLSCLKHFPGLGAASIDPHTAVAEVEYEEMIWQQREMIPFAAGVKKGADLIMTTHLRLTNLDSAIITASAGAIETLLRDCLAFDGLIITDDLSMGGAAELGNIGDRVVTAFEAGHDILLIGQDFDATMEAYEHFANSVERGEISEQRLRASLNRISGVKFKLESSVLQ